MKDTDKLWHYVNARQWKHFDAMFYEFRDEASNIRFMLIIDGMDPFDDLNSS